MEDFYIKIDKNPVRERLPDTAASLDLLPRLARHFAHRDHPM